MSKDRDPEQKYQPSILHGWGIAIGDSAKVVINGINEKVFKRFKIEQRLGFAIMGGLVILSAAAVIYVLLPRSPEYMTGDFRVAVAGFSEFGNSDQKGLGKELAEGVKLRLEQNLAEVNPSLVIQIWGPDQAGFIQGQTAAEREENAGALAKRIRADMIIYGVVDTTGSAWRVAPEFYVSSENFYQAQEIVGQHELGAPFSLHGQANIASRVELGNQFSTRSHVLANITIGLAYYALQKYPEALLSFQSAESIPDLKDDQGREVLYLLIGNAAGRSDKLDLAQEYYEKALALDPEYARAYIGMGSISYVKALQPFEQTQQYTDIDEQLLDKSIQYHLQALQARHQPGLPDIETKVHFGLAQAYFVKAMHLAAHQDENASNNAYLAVEQFEQVVIDYGNGTNPRIREIAAESHARLGLIFDFLVDITRSASEYKQACDLLYDNPERQKLYCERANELLSIATDTPP